MTSHDAMDGERVALQSGGEGGTSGGGPHAETRRGRERREED